MKKNYVIVGLGLLGGSLGAAISKHVRNARVIGVSRHVHKINFAKKKKFIHKGSTDLKSAVRAADYIFICTPVDTISKLILEVDRYAKDGAIVTDVGSTKSEIVTSIERKKLKHLQFVGSHPLAGSHLTGAEHSRSDLFNHAFVFVTPSKNTSLKAIREISLFWKKLNAKVQIVSPQIHDEIVSEISHLPHAVAALLMHTVSSKALSFAASGFLDTTRIAEGDPRLWAPIFLSNRKNVLKQLKKLEKTLRKFKTMLNQKSKGRLFKFLLEASRKRSKAI